MLALLGALSPVTAASADCGAEAEMRASALGSSETELSDAYLLCHQDEHMFAVKRHRERIIEESDLDRARQADTPELWKAFLQEHPGSDQAMQAAEAVRRLDFQEYPGSALAGRKLDAGGTESVARCRSACSHRSSCKGFTFEHAGRLCTLWSVVASRRATTDADSGSRGTMDASPAAPPPPPSPAPVSSPAAVTFMEFSGNTLSGARLNNDRMRDIAECRAWCGANASCRGFTFFPDRGFCTLWSSIGALIPNRRAISGQRLGAEPPGAPAGADAAGFTREPDTDYPGGDLAAFYEIDRDECERSCAGLPACAIYTYNVERRACFLKRAGLDGLFFSGAISGRRR